MLKVELTNMVMIQDKATNKVLVQERVKNWKGISFPGGHVDEGESFVDSAIREIKEETGLDIKNLKSCGVIHWSNNKTFERYIVFLYKTTDYAGTLLNETEEGKVFWLSPEKIKEYPNSNDFDKYLPMFFENDHNEGFGSWNQDDPGSIVYK